MENLVVKDKKWLEEYGLSYSAGFRTLIYSPNCKAGIFLLPYLVYTAENKHLINNTDVPIVELRLKAYRISKNVKSLILTGCTI